MLKSIEIMKVLGLSALLASASAAAAAKDFGPWSAPVKAADASGELNTVFNDGCPIQSPDGLSLYIATNRPNDNGPAGNLDIWVAHRARADEPWGAPVNLGPTVNSAADDFCPAPTRGGRLFFVSKRLEPNGDIYVTRLGPSGWEEPERLDFNVNGSAINSPAQEWSPSYYEDEDGHEVLYFGSTRSGGQGGQDIYFSVDFGLVHPAQGLNTTFDDARPNVSKNGREIVFDSTRPGGILTPTGAPSPDVWTATRATTQAAWSNVTHLENGINSPGGETRASLSWDGATLTFGSTRAGGAGGASEGQGDVYESTREQLTGHDEGKHPE